MGVGAEAKVLDGLTGVLGATEEDTVRASGGTESELIEGEALAASLLNARAGSRSEAKGADGHLGDLKHAVVVSHGTNDGDGLALVLLGGVGVGGNRNDARDGHRWAVDLGHKQAAEDDLVKVGVGTAGEEAVELHKEREVGVLGLWRLPVATLDCSYTVSVYSREEDSPAFHCHILCGRGSTRSAQQAQHTVVLVEIDLCTNVSLPSFFCRKGCRGQRGWV